MLGLCLVGVFLAAAMAATSASALPEFGECVAKAGGKYTDSNCTAKAKVGAGSFEFKKTSELEKRSFVGQNVGSGGVLATAARWCEESNGNLVGTVTRAACAAKGGKQHVSAPGEIAKVECEAEKNHGEITGPTTVTNVTVVFFGCKLLGSIPCSNGPGEGEVQVNLLKGKLGYINKKEHKAGILLEPKVKGNFVSFNCGGPTGNNIIVGVGSKTAGAEFVKGTRFPSGCNGECVGATPEEEAHGGDDGIISPITPVNVMTSHYTQVYTVNSETVENIPSKFEGKPLALLEDHFFSVQSPGNGIEWSKAGEEVTNASILCEPKASNCTPGSQEAPGEIKA
jgi:hypothetical protein